MRKKPQAGSWQKVSDDPGKVGPGIAFPGRAGVIKLRMLTTQKLSESVLATIEPGSFPLPDDLEPGDREKFDIPPLTDRHVSKLFNGGALTGLPGGYLLDRQWRLSPFTLTAANPKGVTPSLAWRARAKRLLTRKREHFDTAIWPTNRSHDAVYGWLVSALPNLYLLKKHQIHPPVLLPQRLYEIPRIAQSVELFADKLDIRYLETGCMAVVDNMWIIGPLSPPRESNRIHNGQVLRETADYIKRKIGIRESTAKEKLYVSRQHSRRRLENPAQVEAMIADHGFREVFLEDLDFAEQVRLFANASAVISVHGAGMANLMFCNSGTKVIEITHSAFKRHFFDLAVALDLDYRYINGTPQPDSRGKIRSTGNISLDPQKLQSTLGAFDLG
jgi:Glycosyltransferase 61